MTLPNMHLAGGFIVIASILAGYHLFLSPLAMGTSYRSVLAHWFWFFGFLGVTITLSATLMYLLLPFKVPAWMTIAAVISGITTAIMALWSSPPKVGTDGEREASPSEIKNDRAPENLRSSSPQAMGRLSKGLVLLLLIGVPVVVVAHVQQNWPVYGKIVSLHQETQMSDAVAQRDRSRPVSPVPLAVDSMVTAIHVSFLTTADPTCVEEDSLCKEYNYLVGHLRDNKLLFIAKATYFFIILFILLSYLGWLNLIRYEERGIPAEDLGLREDIIKRSAPVVSAAGALIAALALAGTDFRNLGLFSGIVGAGLSVALGGTISDLVSGFLLLWDRTIKRNDVITLPRSESSDTGSTYGIVKKMTMRYTVVEDRNDVRRLVPNSYLTNNVVENWTHEKNRVRLRIFVSVAYGEDLGHVKKLLESVCYEVKGVLKTADYFSVRFWMEDPDRGLRPILSDVYLFIYERLRKEGIKIPFPQRELHFPVPELAAPRSLNQGNSERLERKASLAGER